MTATAPTTATLTPLPEIHPGTPGWGTVRIKDLKVIAETDKAIQFERGNKRAWMPKAAVSVSRRGYWGEIADVSVKVWFYFKIYKSL